jgi:hypothetical protein
VVVAAVVVKVTDVTWGAIYFLAKNSFILAIGLKRGKEKMM